MGRLLWGRRYFSKGETYHFRDYLSRADFSQGDILMWYFSVSGRIHVRGLWLCASGRCTEVCGRTRNIGPLQQSTVRDSCSLKLADLQHPSVN